MNPRLPSLALLLAIPMLSSCSTKEGSETKSLEVAQSLWQAYCPHGNYRIVGEKCGHFCNWTKFEVVVKGGKAPSGDFTIEELFKIQSVKIRSDEKSLKMRYHKEYGYPVEWSFRPVDQYRAIEVLECSI